MAVMAGKEKTNRVNDTAVQDALYAVRCLSIVMGYLIIQSATLDQEVFCNDIA